MSVFQTFRQASAAIVQFCISFGAKTQASEVSYIHPLRAYVFLPVAGCAVISTIVYRTWQRAQEAK